MNIALISDIHGNCCALDAVLADLATSKIDQIICLGDALSSGPQPEAVLKRLRSLDVSLVLGNTDQRLLHPVSLDGQNEHVRMLMEIEIWIRQIIPENELAWLGNAKPTVSVKLPDQSVLLCCHGSPRSVSEYLTADSSDERLLEALDQNECDLLAAGHTHVPMLRTIGQLRLLNPGTTGSATGAGPLARYAILEADEVKQSVKFCSVPYDVQPAIQAAKQSGMPHADWWINNWSVH